MQFKQLLRFSDTRTLTALTRNDKHTLAYPLHFKVQIQHGEIICGTKGNALTQFNTLPSK